MIDEVLGRVTAYADAVAAGYTGTREQFSYDLAHAADYASTAGTAAEHASESEVNAKASEEAAGQSEENAQGYAQDAHDDAAAALEAKGQAIVAKNDAVTAKGLAENYATIANNAKVAAAQSEQNASASAESASDDAENASNSANSASVTSLKSEGFAVGEQNGVPVESGSTYYENSSKYYSEQAAAQLALVTNEGTRQIGLVTDEGTAQKNAVQEKGAQTLESIPEDYTALSNDVSELKSDLNAVSDVEQATDLTVLNAYVTSNTITSASYRRLVYASVGNAKTVTVHKMLSKYFTIGFTVATPANGVSVDNIITQNDATSITATVPDGAKYVVAAVYNSNTDTIPWETVLASISIDLLLGAKDNNARNDIAMLTTEVSGYSDDIIKNSAFRTDVANKKQSYNLFDGELKGGYISKDGTLTTGGTYKHTNKIDVHDLVGQTLYFYNDGTQKYIRFVCIYDENNNVKSTLGTDTNSLTFTIPAGAYYAVLSFTGSSVTTPYLMITTDATKTIYMPNRDEWEINGYDAVNGAINIPVPVELRSASLETGESISGNANSVKRLGTYIFYCKPGTMTEDAYIIFGKDTSKGYAVGISATQWAWFVNNVNQGGGTHGLTIKDYLLVVVNKVPGTGAVLTIYTNGGTYTRTNTSWLDDHGAPYVYNDSGDTITDVKMSWTSSAFRNRNWVFGDSYVTIASTRWPKYVYDLGFGENLMINGYPGEQSEVGYKDFLECLKYGKPSVMAWCLGMNDEDSGAVNASWLKYVTAFLDICKLYDIEPILATIPCCPIADHQYKNAWVKASGYRYIDFASAVNVSENSTTWFDGMLSDDNIHPTAQGAIALASQVLTDFPELLID